MCLRAVKKPPVLSVFQQQIGVDEEDGGIVKASAVLLQYSSNFICFVILTRWKNFTKIHNGGIFLNILKWKGLTIQGSSFRGWFNGYNLID